MASSQPRFKPVESPIADQGDRPDSEFMARKVMSIANRIARGARNPLVLGERMLASTISGEIAKELIKGGQLMDQITRDAFEDELEKISKKS